MKCKCHSQKEYEVCCGPYHTGKLPDTPSLLMRSRYSAYAMKLIDYIIATTHNSHPQFHANPSHWRQEISDFCENTAFEGLDILHEHQDTGTATVTFIAKLRSGKNDLSFKETSTFIKEGGRWYYHSGTVEPL